MSGAAALSKFGQYIEAYNQHDIDCVLSFLADDIQVFVNDDLAAEGAEALRPSYVSDFDEKKKVTVVKDPSIVNEDEVSATVAVTLNTGKVQLDVLYVFRLPDLKQVKHKLSNIVNLD
ncbi:unnamed protein product [Symbiodinium natans]|uniref:SnoaL-like domain-containing protein n=1 Tax=Symbiodinium natans TaxID=878477 RepID=A0A812RWZ3_9DINO|nr:unnamed protein product [Symbiodinium natans]